MTTNNERQYVKGDYNPDSPERRVLDELESLERNMSYAQYVIKQALSNYKCSCKNNPDVKGHDFRCLRPYIDSVLKTKIGAEKDDAKTWNKLMEESKKEAHENGYRGVLAITGRCLNCFDNSQNYSSLGTIEPKTDELDSLSDGAVVIYLLCPSCEQPNYDMITAKVVSVLTDVKNGNPAIINNFAFNYDRYE